MPLLPVMSSHIARRRSLTGALLAIVVTAGAGAQQRPAQTVAGTSSQVSIPAWVPIYPGAQVGVPRSDRGGVERTIWFTISTGDPCERVGRFYEERLNRAGFSVVKSPPDEDRCVRVLQSHDAAGTRKVNLSGGILIKESRGRPVKATEYEVEVIQLTDAR
jgi:hypothetical protein